MSQVTLSIAGRKYTLACAPGQEAHVARLGASIDAKLAEMGDNLAPQEAQNLLFAALLIAEDLHQLRNSATADTGELDRLRTTLDERERELETLQGSVKSVAQQADEVRAEMARLRGEVEDAEQVEAELRAGLDGLVEERDALQAEVEDLRRQRAAAPPLGSAMEDPGLAPALEHFAELLENCADKLEGKAEAS